MLYIHNHIYICFYSRARCPCSPSKAPQLKRACRDFEVSAPGMGVVRWADRGTLLGSFPASHCSRGTGLTYLDPKMCKTGPAQFWLFKGGFKVSLGVGTVQWYRSTCGTDFANAEIASPVRMMAFWAPFGGTMPLFYILLRSRPDRGGSLTDVFLVWGRGAGGRGYGLAV